MRPMTNPWFSMWIHPRETMRWILSHDADRDITLLIVIMGVARALDRAVLKSTGDYMSVGVILAMSVLLGDWGIRFSIRGGSTPALDREVAWGEGRFS